MIKRWFKRWNLLGCPECGCKETESHVMDTIQHIACEVEYTCAKCGSHVNYWAYGHFMEPTTKTETLRYRLDYWKWRVVSRVTTLRRKILRKPNLWE